MSKWQCLAVFLVIIVLQQQSYADDTGGTGGGGGIGVLCNQGTAETSDDTVEMLDMYEARQSFAMPAPSDVNSKDESINWVVERFVPRHMLVLAGVNESNFRALFNGRPRDLVHDGKVAMRRLLNQFISESNRTVETTIRSHVFKFDIVRTDTPLDPTDDHGLSDEALRAIVANGCELVQIGVFHDNNAAICAASERNRCLQSYRPMEQRLNWLNRAVYGLHELAYRWHRLYAEHAGDGSPIDEWDSKSTRTFIAEALFGSRITPIFAEMERSQSNTVSICFPAHRLFSQWQSIPAGFVFTTGDDPAVEGNSLQRMVFFSEAFGFANYSIGMNVSTRGDPSQFVERLAWQDPRPISGEVATIDTVLEPLQGATARFQRGLRPWRDEESCDAWLEHNRDYIEGAASERVAMIRTILRDRCEQRRPLLSGYMPLRVSFAIDDLALPSWQQNLICVDKRFP